VVSRDITEGRGSASANIGRAIAVDLGITADSSVWTNTDVAYDVALGGMPFIYAVSDARPYTRQTAPYKKEQFDNNSEPGEQSLTGWWIRSQSSFHAGTGINFYDPSAGEVVAHRFTDSQNVNVWTKGQVTLLKDTENTHITTGPVVGTDHQHPQQHVRSIQWSGLNGVLLHDEYDVDKIYPAITVSITNKALTTNVATLTTSAAHGLSTGMEITITGVDATFNGTYTITGAPTTTTFTYAKVATNVTSTAVSPAGTGVTDPVIHFIDYNTGSAEAVYAICDDGVYAYWVTNAPLSGTPRLHMYKKLLTDNTTTIPSPMFTANSITIQYAAMEFVKDRIVLCINNAVYEVTATATSLPTAIYTNPNTSYHYTSVAASGPAIYTAGHSGIYSTIQKYTLSNVGVMPTLTSAVVAAELPAGEIVEKLYYYLGYMCIGTNKGMRVADINDQDGSLSYGPLIFESSQPVYDFAARDRFIWAASGIGALDAGLHRIDLGNEIETLRFAYAKDLQVVQSAEHYTTGVAFLGATNRLAFCTAYEATNGAIYLESASTLAPTGYIKTGKIRYGTLEPKNFKRLIGRGVFNVGETILSSIGTNDDGSETEYDHIAYNTDVNPVEVTTSVPGNAQEFLAYKFTLNRDSANTTLGPIFKGYQAKSTIATPRVRVIQFPVYCFDIETDRYNTIVGYEGRAFDRIRLLEEIEKTGDVITWQDLTTSESLQAVIENISFTRMTPPDRRFDGFGGIIEIMIRTV
jgi:hypothetical protein